MQKALTKLSEDGKVMEKVYGKIKVYYAKQPDTAADPAELDSMDKLLETLKERVQTVTKECETLTASMRPRLHFRVHLTALSSARTLFVYDNSGNHGGDQEAQGTERHIRGAP